MSNDIEGFDIRQDFLMKLLRGYPVSPLNAMETQIMNSKAELLDINKEIGGAGVLGLISSTRGLINIRDMLFLLLDAYDENMLYIAKDIINTAIQEENVLTTESIARIFYECTQGMIPELMVAVMGEHKPEPNHLSNQTQSHSSLNLDAMRDFQ